MGLHLAGSLPTLDFDCGLGTSALLLEDVATPALAPEGGVIGVRRVVPDEELLARNAATPERTAWWFERLERCHALLA